MCQNRVILQASVLTTSTVFSAKNRSHLTALCPKKFGVTASSNSASATTNASASSNVTTGQADGSVQNSSKSFSGSVIDSVSSLSAVNQSAILTLAQIPVCHPQVQQRETNVLALLDSGSQRTYVTEDLAHSLKLPSAGKETLHIDTFGNSESLVHESKVVNCQLKTSEWEKASTQGQHSPFLD